MFGHPKVGSTKFQRICLHPNVDNVVANNPDLLLPTAIAGVALHVGVKLISDKDIWPGADKATTDAAVFEAAIFGLYRVRRAFSGIVDIPEYVGIENFDQDEADEIVGEGFAAASEMMVAICTAFTTQPEDAARRRALLGVRQYMSLNDSVPNLLLALDELSSKRVLEKDPKKMVARMMAYGAIERTIIPAAVEGVATAIKMEIEN